MKIDKKLNLVSTINRDGASPVYLHVLPFPYEVVEEHCFLLGNLFSNFINQVGGLGAARVAAMMLRKKLKQQQDDAGIVDTGAPTIIDEIQRLATVIYSSDEGWKAIPLDTAMKQEIVTPDEYREIEGEIVFFMVSSAIQKRELIAPTVGAVIKMYGGQLVSLSATEYRASLLTSSQATDTQPQSAPQETSFIPS